MSTPPDLLDFLSMPTVTAAKPAAAAPAGAVQHSSTSRTAASSASNHPTATATSPSGDGESFDLSGALAAEQAAEADREHAFSGAPGDDDLWNSLHEEPATGAGGDRRGSASGRTSTSQTLRLQPDSSLYAASKRLDSLSARMDAAAGRAIDSINAMDRRHGVSAALRTTDAKYAVSGRLEGMQEKLTRSADKISHDFKQQVHKVKEAREAKSRRNSGSENGNSAASAGRSAAGQSDMPQSRSGSRRPSGQFISIGAADRIPHPSAPESDSDDDEPNPSPTAASGFAPAVLPVAMPVAAAAAGHGPRSKVSSSFSYEPQAVRAPHAHPTAAAAAGSTGKATVIPPPAALFELPPPLRGAHDSESEDDEDASDVDSPAHTPSSSAARSRSNSISFTNLRLGDVDLGAGGSSGDGLLSPDGPSPHAGGGLLGR